MTRSRGRSAAQLIVKNIGESVVRVEADALRALADRLAGPMLADFERAVELLYGCAGRVVVTGMGKSGLITGEILQLLATVKRLGVPLITLPCDDLHSTPEEPRGRSTLAQAADVALDCSVAHEACSLGLAPTASTTTMLALGDALAVALSERRGFKEEDFANLHPGGKLGKRFARVSSLMHMGNAVPSVSPSTPMTEVIYEMSRKALGMATVVEGEKLVGLISDGDLRRLLEHHGKQVFDLTAGECMTRSPKVVGPEIFAIAALDIMERKKITSLPVIDDAGRLLGVLHLHDLWGTQML